MASTFLSTILVEKLRIILAMVRVGTSTSAIWRKISAPGTAGSLALLPEVPEVPFISMNGDLLTDLNVSNLVDYHSANAAAATMAVCDFSMQVPYGVVRIGGNSVLGIEEKPMHTFRVNAGIYVYDPAVLHMLKAGVPLDAPELIHRIIADGKRVVAFPMREMWLDIGRQADLEQARLKWGDLGG